MFKVETVQVKCRKRTRIYICVSLLSRLTIKHWSCIISIETKIREEAGPGLVGTCCLRLGAMPGSSFCHHDWLEGWRLPKSNLGVSVQGNGLTSDQWAPVTLRRSGYLSLSLSVVTLHYIQSSTDTGKEIDSCSAVCRFVWCYGLLSLLSGKMDWY